MNLKNLQVIANRRETFLQNNTNAQEKEDEQPETSEHQFEKRKNYALLDLLLSAQLDGNEPMSDEDIREEVG